MTRLTLSRFQTMTHGSKPDITFEKQWEDADGDYNFADVLLANAEWIRDSGETHYFSLSRWKDEHNQWGHEGTTCVTLAYYPEAADHFRAVAIEADLAHYEFPIRAGHRKARMFAIPTEDNFTHTETFRAASLIADVAQVQGLVKNSYQSTYFFRFDGTAEVVQRGSTLLSDAILACRNYVKIDQWVA